MGDDPFTFKKQTCDISQPTGVRRQLCRARTWTWWTTLSEHEIRARFNASKSISQRSLRSGDRKLGQSTATNATPHRRSGTDPTAKVKLLLPLTDGPVGRGNAQEASDLRLGVQIRVVTISAHIPAKVPLSRRLLRRRVPRFLNLRERFNHRRHAHGRSSN